MYGTSLEIRPSTAGGDVLISSSKISKADIYASNGVLHTISSLLIPPGTFQLTPEKYLLALNFTYFVSVLHSVNLTYLINSTAPQYTILAPSNDMLEFFGSDDFPEGGSGSLRKLMQYHFILGAYTPEALKNGMLVETALDESGLEGGRQVVGVETHAGDGKGKDGQTLRFGGVSAQGGHGW